MKALEILLKMDTNMKASQDYGLKYDSELHKDVKVAIMELLLTKDMFNESMGLMLDNNKNGKYDLIIQEIESIFESK